VPLEQGSEGGLIAVRVESVQELGIAGRATRWLGEQAAELTKDGGA
jgi:hypothetical protein